MSGMNPPPKALLWGGMYLGETADVLAKRGTPAQRAAGWKSFKETNPGKSYDDFLAELDAGIVAHKADDEAVKQANKTMRQELFTDIPPQQRKQFENTAIDVVSDAEFERLTRSAKGQAVVIIEDGKPRVLMRESADPKVLREEGIHLMQSVDPTKAHLFKKLDEAKLKNWDNLPLDEQLSIYRAKLDLEIDGQQQLIKNLDEQLAAVGDDPAARKQIMDRLEDARDSLDSLTSRLDEVGSISPQKQLDIASGKVAKPDFLDQPARLFGKKSRAQIQREVLDTLKAAGLDVTNARTVLNKLRKAAKQPGQGKVFDEVVDKFEKLAASNPKTAKSYIDELRNVTRNWKGPEKSTGYLAVVSASTKVKNPVGFLKTANKIATTGKDHTERISKNALDDIAEKIARLSDPEAGHKYLDEIVEIYDAFKPRKPRHISGFLQATAKLDDSTAFTASLKKFAGNLKKKSGAIPDDVLRHTAYAVGKLDSVKAAKYLDGLDSFVSTFSKKELGEYLGFIVGSRSARSGDPANFLAASRELIAQRAHGLSKEGLDVLAAKAGRTGGELRRRLDVEWLVTTDLFKDKNVRELFDFMAQDPKTMWNVFRRAATKPDSFILTKAERAMRGIAGEYLTFLRTKQIKTGIDLIKNPWAKKVMNSLKKLGILEIVERQLAIITKLGRTEIDFTVLTNVGKHGLEVKTYKKEYWMLILEAWDLRSNLGPKQFAKLHPGMVEFVKSLDHMIKQLNNAGKKFGNPPFLMTTDGIDKIGPKWQAVWAEVQKKFPKGTKIAKMSEDDVGRQEAMLRKLMGIK